VEPVVKDFLWDDFEKTSELIAAGEAAARAALPDIRAALLPGFRHERRLPAESLPK
jgi:hypothetical protein